VGGHSWPPLGITNTVATKRNPPLGWGSGKPGQFGTQEIRIWGFPFGWRSPYTMWMKGREDSPPAHSQGISPEEGFTIFMDEVLISRENRETLYSPCLGVSSFVRLRWAKRVVNPPSLYRLGFRQ
jgi:hypothetical protein